ncbi:hypothetical protein HYG81_21140 (plasmid) [Natrinema zhouii]|nr:hypothetical protein [Natrinema zhouii]UHQ98424.1 hypothetical protein HYG81_21140 [Natrinema zhouii]
MYAIKERGVAFADEEYVMDYENSVGS